MQRPQLQRLLAVIAINIPLVGIIDKLFDNFLIAWLIDFVICFILVWFVNWLYWSIYKHL